MNQAAFSDESVAYDEVTGLVLQVATEREWTAEESDLILADVDAAHQAAGEWLEVLSLTGLSSLLSSGEMPHDVATFWAEIGRRSATWTAPGADKLRAVWGAADTSTQDAADQAALSSPLGQAEGTAAATAADLASMAAAAKAAAQNPTGSPYFWLLLAAAAVVVVVAVKK